MALVLAAGGVIFVVQNTTGKTTYEPPPSEKNTAPPDIASVPPGWKEVASRQGRFRVLFPGSPRLHQRTMASPVGPVDDTAYLLDTPDRSVMVSFADFTGYARKDADLMGIIQDGRDAVRKHLRGAVVRDRDIKLNGNPGKEVAIQTANQGTAYFRWYAVNRRLYTLAIMGTKTTPPADEVERFFNSFQLTR
jgi:hypothetical protein